MPLITLNAFGCSKWSSALSALTNGLCLAPPPTAAAAAHVKATNVSQRPERCGSHSWETSACCLFVLPEIDNVTLDRPAPTTQAWNLRPASWRPSVSPGCCYYGLPWNWTGSKTHLDPKKRCWGVFRGGVRSWLKGNPGAGGGGSSLAPRWKRCADLPN